MADDALPFDEVYRRHRDAVFWYCLSQTRDRTLAEDICGDVFTAALAAYERVQPDAGGVLAWLFRIARNTVAEHGRRAARWRLLVPTLGLTRGRSVESVAAIRDDVRAIGLALAELPSRDRRLIGMRVAAGLSFADIGKAEGVSDDTAEAATRRALKRLRDILHRRNEPGEGWVWEDTE